MGFRGRVEDRKHRLAVEAADLLLPEQQLLLLFGAKLGEHLLGRGLWDTVIQGQHLGDDVEIFRRTGRDTRLDQEVLELIVVAERLEATGLLDDRNRLRWTEWDVGLLVETEVAGTGVVAEDTVALEVRDLLIERNLLLDG